MAGQQHSFSPGFPNVQQSTMRTQFGGGEIVSGLMGHQQGGIVSPQQFGVGVGVGVGLGGVGSNAMGMQNAQQVLTQQHQQQSAVMQQQMQQMQQQQMQLQQHQTALLQQTNQTSNQVTTPQTPVAPTQPLPQQQQNKDLNTATLCKFGQETVQDIVSRTLDVFQTLKVLQPPNGTSQGASIANSKKTKVQEQLMTLKMLFNRLRRIYEKCNENCQLQGMEYTHIESLIPLKEEWDMKSEEKKTSEAYRLAYKESEEIMEQVILKNKHLKEIIDKLRRIIFEINIMLNMRRS